MRRQCKCVPLQSEFQPIHSPDSQQYTASRKRSWAQKVLGGRPSLAGYDDLFDSGSYLDLAASEENGSSQKLLSCVEEKETEIVNNTCVLGMSYSYSFSLRVEANCLNCSAGSHSRSLLSYVWPPDPAEHRRVSIRLAHGTSSV